MAKNFSAASTGEAVEAGVQNLEEVCMAAARSEGLQAAAQSFDRIILAMFAANLALIFTHRALTREDFWKIEIGKKEIRLPTPRVSVPERYVESLDNILFTLNFALVSYLTVVRFLTGKVTIN